MTQRSRASSSSGASEPSHAAGPSGSAPASHASASLSSAAVASAQPTTTPAVPDSAPAPQASYATAAAPAASSSTQAAAAPGRSPTSAAQQHGAVRSADPAPSSSSTSPDPSSGGLDNMITQLQSYLEDERQKLKARESQIQEQEARQKAEMAKIAASGVREQDVVHLNVGGTLISTTRKTLCLVPDSLLETMFSGRWEESCTKDEAGRVFFDLDPELFGIVLNWLRMFAVASPTVEVPEPEMPHGKEDAFMVLCDYLQLNRYMPLRFDEAFNKHLHSPLVLINGAVATRLEPPKAALVQVAASAHSYFDVHVDLLLRVTAFHSASSGGAFPMTVGFMAKDRLERAELSESRDAKITWQHTFHGWWTGGQEGYAIQNGRKAQARCRDDYLWYPGDMLRLTLDCRKHLPTPRITLLNSMSKVQQAMDVSLASQPAPVRHTRAGRRAAAAAAAREAGAAAGPGMAGAAATAGAAAATRAAAAAGGNGNGAVPAAAPNAAHARDAGAGASTEGGGAVPERAASSMEWVLVVGLTHPEDEVQIVSARRHGMRPC